MSVLSQVQTCITCLAVLLLASATVDARVPDLDAEALEYIDSDPVVTIGVVADNEPYSQVENGKVSGFSVDVLEDVARNTGLEFRYRMGSWPEIYQAFLRGEIDAIDGISFHEDRAALMRFTEPYHFRQTVIMHDRTRPLPELKSIDDLRPYRVGVVRDIYYQAAFVERGIAVTEYDGVPSMMSALAFGWVDAIAGPQVTLSFAARKAGFSHLSVAGRVAMDGLDVEDFRLAVLRDQPVLHRILEAGLASIPRERFEALLLAWQDFGGQMVVATLGLRLSEQQTAYVRRLGPIRVGFMRDYAPFSFVDGGNLQGLSVDVFSRLQDLTGLQVVPVADRWPVLFELFQRGEIDVIAGISDTPERRDFTRFTEPYYAIPNVVFSREAALRVRTLDDLNGRRIAVGSGIFYEDAMQARFGDAVVTFSAQDAMFHALAEGSVDVVLAALPNGNHWVRELGLTDVRIAGELRYEGYVGEDLRLGVRPALEPLAGILDQALATITPTERRIIENRWMGAAPTVASGSGERFALGEAEAEWLAARGGRVSVCIDPSWMPLEGFDPHGRHVGLSSDYLALFDSRFGVDFEVLRTATWSDSIAAVKDGRCDMLSLAMQTPERLSYLNFTTPYYTMPTVMLARVEAPFIDGLDELAGRRIGIARDYAFVELLRTRYPRLKLIEVDNEIDGLQRLQRGDLYGFVSSLVTASYNLQELGLADIKVIGRVPGDWALSFAMRKDEPALLAIAQALVDSVADDDRRRIDDKWRTFRIEAKPDYSLLWRILAIAGLALLLLFLWNRKLGSLNRQLSAANDQLAKLSVTDSLTGIGNRKYHDQEFEKSFRWCQRNRVGFTVAMIDIDHFKLINDTWGHQIGDECLQMLARCLQAGFRRETDRLARLGGEEFIVFSSWQNEAEVLARFEELRAAVEGLRLSSGSGAISLTVSIGVAASMPEPTDRADVFLKRADDALYEAKRAGRNRVVVYRSAP